MPISTSLAQPYCMEFPPELAPQRAVTEVVRALKQHPEGVEARIGGTVATFRSSTMVVDILKFFRDTVKPSVAPAAPVRELVVEANPAGIEVAEAPDQTPDKPARKRSSSKRKKK
jgi:hypothetical protein